MTRPAQTAGLALQGPSRQVLSSTRMSKRTDDENPQLRGERAVQLRSWCDAIDQAQSLDVTSLNVCMHEAAHASPTGEGAPFLACVQRSYMSSWCKAPQYGRSTVEVGPRYGGTSGSGSTLCEAPAETAAGVSPLSHAAHRWTETKGQKYLLMRRDPGARHQHFCCSLWCAKLLVDARGQHLHADLEYQASPPRPR